MAKSIKGLFLVCCFALASVSVQALACDQHAEKADTNTATQTATTESETTCACGKETCDDCDACEKCNAKKQKS